MERNKKPGKLRGQRNDTTGRPNLWAVAACHQGTLTRFLAVARKTPVPIFQTPWVALEGRLMSHSALLVPMVLGSSAFKMANLHRGEFTA